MDLGVFDAWAGLLISHPHHQLSAAPSVSQITEFVVVVWPEDKKGGRGVNFSKWSFLLTSSMSAHILVLIRKCVCVCVFPGLFNKFICVNICVTICICEFAVLHTSHVCLCVFVCVIYLLFTVVLIPCQGKLQPFDLEA